LPTIISHAAVPLAIGIGLGRNIVSPRLLLAGVAVSMLPDSDVIGFNFGVAYDSAFGHRGFTHSLFSAIVVASAAACAWRQLQSTLWKSFMFVFVAMASHGILDSFTNGGRGIAFLWPFSTERFFAPYRVIEVSPIGIAPLLSARGVAVFASEAVWVWAPCLLLCALLLTWRHNLKSAGNHS
jgi:inner membrane protein